MTPTTGGLQAALPSVLPPSSLPPSLLLPALLDPSVLLPVLLAGTAVAVRLGLPYRASPPGGGHLASAAGRGRALATGGTAIVVLLAVLPVLGAAGAVVAVVLGLVARRSAAARKRRQARDGERAGAGEALTVLASELRAGRVPAAALQSASSVAVGSFAVTLLSAARSGGLGVDPAASLRAGADLGDVPEVLRGLAACWQVCGSTGSSLAVAVESLAESVHAERDQQLSVEAELAGPRATAALLAGLPLLGIGLAAAMGAHPLTVLLHTVPGGVCLLTGVGLDLTGLWWTGRLVARAGER